MLRPACVLAALIALTGCPDKGSPAPADPAPAGPTPTAQASASASPADIAAATKAYETFKKRIEDGRDVVAPYRLEKKRAPACAKRAETEPALLIDRDHATTTIRRHQEPHWGRVTADLEVLQYKGFLESDRKDLRDWPFDPKGALPVIERLNATKATIFIDVEETRPVVGDGDAYTPGKAKGVAWVLDSKGAVCTVPLEYKQSGSVKFESLVFDDDPRFNELDKQASAAVAVAYAYDHAIALQVEEKLKPLGWTNIAMPRALKK